MKEGYGDFIKKHRIASGYKKQNMLAEKTGISAATISRIENEIQKPEVRTIQTLSQFLPTTSYVELMVACGYWKEDDLLLEEIELKPKPIPMEQEIIPRIRKIYPKTKTPTSNEEEFLNDIDLSDEQLLNKFQVKIDGQPLTKEETQGIIAYIRSLRTMKS